jgi:DNA-binding transcriptional MerR regulator
MFNDSVQPQPTEQTVTATDAAGRIGISIDQLRMWSQPDQFGRYLTAPRTNSGRRRYTDHDIAVCKLIRHWHEQNAMTYRQIAERFDAQGVDHCLQMAIGIEQTNLVLQEETDRLRKQLADQLIQMGQLQEISRRWNEARAVGVSVMQNIEAKRAQAERELEFLEQAQRRAARHLQQAQNAIEKLGLWSWLTGGRQRAVIHVQESQLAYAEAVERIATMHATMQNMTLLQMQKVLNLPTGDIKINITEAAATADRPPQTT